MQGMIQLLPANTINLDGSRSTDPDNNISSYVCAKISGPSSTNITIANAAQAQVSDLVEGIYRFEVKATDAGGLFSKDAKQVTVNAAASINHPSVANAGNDASITPPENTINLHGSRSWRGRKNPQGS
jgi:hypothetical protein